MTYTNKPLRYLAGALSALALTSALQAADAGTWGVRLRATYVDTANKSDAFSALGINFAADSVHVESLLIPEFDVDYWFSPNLSAELVLTIPQEHQVSLAGVGRLGAFKELPPCLVMQYHFMPAAKFQSYIGAGVNFTLIFDKDVSVAGVPLGLEDSSVGLVLEAGCDYDLGDGMYLNADVRNVGLRSDVSAGGAKLTTAKLDPWLYSVGWGWRF